MKKTKVAKLTHPIKKEFSWRKAKLAHFPGDDFMRSQWQQKTSSIIYLLYRWAVAIFFTSIVIVTAVKLFMHGKYFIYLTHWGLILCMLSNLYGAILVSVWHWKPNYSETINIHLRQDTTAQSSISDKDTSMIPLSLRIYWALHMTTLNVAIVITFIYWVFLHGLRTEQAPGTESSNDDENIETMPAGLLNILEHALNSIIMIIDLMIVAFPIRILHIIFPIIFAIIYAGFSLIYYLAGGKDERGNHWIYPILDWSKPGIAIGTVFGVFLLFLICSLITFFLYKLRMVVYRKCHNSQMSSFSIS